MREVKEKSEPICKADAVAAPLALRNRERLRNKCVWYRVAVSSRELRPRGKRKVVAGAARA